MGIVGLKTSIWTNRVRSAYLIGLMPILVFSTVFIGYGFNFGFGYDTLVKSISVVGYSLPVLLLWLTIAIILHKNIIFSQVGAEAIERKDYPELFNLVENLAISRGLPTPRIGIMQDDSLNAFATGWNSKNSRIVFSSGLLKKLNKQEIEAVAAHELTHIINEDVKIMLVSTLFIGIVGTIGDILLRVGNSSEKEGKSLVLIGVILYLLSLIVLPFINLAVSRKREYMADAGSVELTKNKNSMISALQKISQDNVIESMDGKGIAIASMCIYSPALSSKVSWFDDLFSTHPSIGSRIEMLEKY